MRKLQTPPIKAEAVSLGKGKVTPVQIAFIVDRYLADSGYTSTLASFRSEASEHFSKTRNREAPKGLLSLAEILDDYVTLKEQRIAVDHEKQRVEALLRGINEAVRAYRGAADDTAVRLPLPRPALPSPSLPTPPLSSSQAAPRTMIPVVATANPCHISPPEHKPTAFSTPIAEASCNNKRKSVRPALKAPSAPKKSRGRSQAEASTSEGIPPPSQPHDLKGNEEKILRLPSDDSECIDQQNSSSSVAKSLFKQLSDRKTCSTSPKTPSKSYSSHADGMASPTESFSVSHNPSVGGACKLTSTSKSSVISSRTIIVSPYKNRGGYYAAKESFCISSSPMNSNLTRQGRRDNVKGRLDFDGTDVTVCKSSAIANDTSPTTDDVIENMFDLDLPDLEIDFSFCELLVNIDLDDQGFDKYHHLTSKSSTDIIARSEEYAGGGCLPTNQDQSAALPGMAHESPLPPKSITRSLAENGERCEEQMEKHA